MKLSVIVPYYRDVASLGKFLPQNRERLPEAEFTVVGAEADAPAEDISRMAGARWVQAAGAGRGRQMNEGAALANGEVYLFLHADTLLPKEAATAIERSLDQGYAGGAFSRRFDSPSLVLRGTCWLADQRGRLSGWFLGDQAIFCARSLFEEVGGYADWVAFEDLDLVRRMRRRAKTTLLRARVLSSARRFARRGALRQTLRDFFLTLQWLGGRSFARKGDHE